MWGEGRKKRTVSTHQTQLKAHLNRVTQKWHYHNLKSFSPFRNAIFLMFFFWGGFFLWLRIHFITQTQHWCMIFDWPAICRKKKHTSYIFIYINKNLTWWAELSWKHCETLYWLKEKAILWFWPFFMTEEIGLPSCVCQNR